MKKIFLIFAMMAITVFAFPQSHALNHSMVTIDRDNAWSVITGTSADTLKKVQDTITWTFNMNNPWSVKYAVDAEFDTVAGTDTTVFIITYAKNFINEAWIALDSATIPKITKASQYSIAAGSAINYHYFKILLKRLGVSTKRKGIRVRRVGINLYQQ